MSWLDDVRNERIFNYKNGDGEILRHRIKDFKKIYGINIEAKAGETIEIDHKVYSYAGFESVEILRRTEVEFEKNGRKGVEIRTKGNKRPTYISKTKLNYMKTGRYDSSGYTKDYKEHMLKQEQDSLLESDTSKGNAKVYSDFVEHQKKNKNIPDNWVWMGNGWSDPEHQKFISLK